MQDVVAVPEIVIETEAANLSLAMRPIFNTAWNAFGFQKSDKYDARGKWIGHA